MIVTYSLTEEDYLTHFLYSASRSPRIKKQRRLMKVVFPLLYLAIGIWEFSQAKFLAAIVFIAIGWLWFLLYPIYNRKRYVRHYRSYIREQLRDSVGQPVTLEIQPDLIRASDPTSEIKIATSELEFVAETGQHFLLKLKGPSTIPVPKHLEERDELRALLKRLCDTHSLPYHEDTSWSWK